MKAFVIFLIIINVASSNVYSDVYSDLESFTEGFIKLAAQLTSENCQDLENFKGKMFSFLTNFIFFVPLAQNPGNFLNGNKVAKLLSMICLNVQLFVSNNKATAPPEETTMVPIKDLPKCYFQNLFTGNNVYMNKPAK